MLDPIGEDASRAEWPHIPVVTASQYRGMWDVYCLGCSGIFEREVYPCKLAKFRGMFPPKTLIQKRGPSERQQIAGEIAAMASTALSKYENGSELAAIWANVADYVARGYRPK